MSRRMSPTRRARIFNAADGVCHICKQKIDGTREKWDVVASVDDLPYTYGVSGKGI